MSLRAYRWSIHFMLLAGVVLASDDKEAAEPLHRTIDRIVGEAGLGVVAPLSGDAEFLRRVHLDLVGTIPTASEAREFFRDGSDHKRVEVIDRLLSDRRHARHMANVFDLFLLERRGGKHVKSEDWQQFLFDSFLSNKPWNELAREILVADGTDSKIRGAAKFYLAREGDPDLITRDVGRAFFGVDLQCCQCHDHPLIDGFYQSDYFGIYAFLNRGFVFTGKDKRVLYAEKAEGDVQFTSVFTEEESSTRPCLPGGVQITEPVFLSGEEYDVKPANKVRPVPRYSRREKLAELATDSTNTAFNRNIVNRLWAYMMGRGLVHPVDLIHDDNSPAHPMLLQVLADNFATNGYDLRRFIRELALSHTYQQSSRVLTDLELRPAAVARKLTESRDALQRSLERVSEREQLLREAEAKLAGLEESLTQTLAQFGDANSAVQQAIKKSTSANKKLNDGQKKLAKKRALAAAVREAAEKSHLAAEQLAGEAEFAEAADKFAARAAQLDKELQSVEKSVTGLADRAEAAVEALAAARSNAAPIMRRLQEGRLQYDRATTPVVAARRQLAAAEAAQKSAEKTIEIVERISRRVELDSEFASRQEQVAMKMAELEGCRTGVAELVAAMPALEQQLAASENTCAAADSQLVGLQERVAAKQPMAKLVAEAAAKASQAVAQLGKNDPLRKSAAVIKTRSEKVQLELNELQAERQRVGEEAAAARSKMNQVRTGLARSRADVEQQKSRISQLEAELPTLKAKVDALVEARSQRLAEWMDVSEQHFFAARLKPLSPEQMGWSVLQATGAAQSQYRASEEEIDRNLPPSPNYRSIRSQAIEQHYYDKLKGSIATFSKLFGHAAGQPQADFFATVDQALFFSNAGVVQSWLKPRRESLTARLTNLKESAAVAEELYLSVLVRYPTAEESADVARWLDEHSQDRAGTIAQLVWSLITSAEFRFNY